MAAGEDGQKTQRAARLIDNPELVTARLRAAPKAPGVYLMRDVEGRVVYVGKAEQLQNRLRSYFTGINNLADRIRTMVERIFDFEVVACGSVREALILENSLIKQYRPRFNIRLKDDKNYLYLKIPKPGSPDTHAPGTAREKIRRPRGEAGIMATRFPRPYYTRRVQRDGAKYFGPYTSAQSLRTTVKSLRGIFPFRTCSDEIFRRGRVCLDYHIKRCSGPCEGKISEADYAELLNQVELFMDGRSQSLVKELKQRMEHASKEMQFESAARFRDRLHAIDRITERQSVLIGRRGDSDCIGMAMIAGRVLVTVMSAHRGKVIGVEHHELEGVSGKEAPECLEAFVTQYYSDTPHIPGTILLSSEAANSSDISEFLAQERSGPVEIRVPQRGELRALVMQAKASAEATLKQRQISEDFDQERNQLILSDLAERLQLPAMPRRIECYDISNTMGTNSVSSMVVFEEGRPNPAQYRQFTIKTVTGADDFASMAETIQRRFGRYTMSPQDNIGDEDVPVLDPDGSNGAARAKRKPKGRREDSSFTTLPDLVLIDGGKGQLNAAYRVIRDAGLDSIPVFGLAKKNEELFRPHVADPILLPRDSPTLFLVQRVRDEAHRFAITKHRSKRGKTALQSKLDIVPGLGPARKRQLLRKFGTIAGISEASVEDLSAVVPHNVALSIKELL